VNTTRANVGTRGGKSGTYRITGGADRVNVRLPGDVASRRMFTDGASLCRIAAKRLTLAGGADRVGVRMPEDADVGQPLPDRGQATAHVATPVQLATGTRLTAVNATRANGGPRGREWRGRDPVGNTCRLAARRLCSQARPVPLWTQTRLPPVNATRANGGTRGRKWRRWGSTCRISAKRLTLTGGADRVGVRLPGDVWAASTCRIAAQRLTLTGGADRVGVRMPDSGQRLTLTGGAVHRRGRSCGRPVRSQAVPIVWASGCLGTWAAAGTCRIAAKLPTLTGGAGPDAGVACGTLCPTSYSVARTSRAATPWPAPCRIAAIRLRPQAGPIVWASGCRIAAATSSHSHVATPGPLATAPALSRPSG